MSLPSHPHKGVRDERPETRILMLRLALGAVPSPRTADRASRKLWTLAQSFTSSDLCLSPDEQTSIPRAIHKPSLMLMSPDHRIHRLLAALTALLISAPALTSAVPTSSGLPVSPPMMELGILPSEACIESERRGTAVTAIRRLTRSLRRRTKWSKRLRPSLRPWLTVSTRSARGPP